MWIAEAEGIPATTWDTEQEAIAAAKALGPRGVHWELTEGEQ